jgi:hypothetical protein
MDALTPPPSLDDERTAAQRRADALTELAMQAITTGRLPLVGGVRPALGILINPTTLIGNTDDSGTARRSAARGAWAARAGAAAATLTR